MKKIEVNGVYRDMTPAEEAEYLATLQDAQPTIEEKISKLEQANAELSTALEALLLKYNK